jgi:hypothetical protein
LAFVFLGFFNPFSLANLALREVKVNGAFAFPEAGIGSVSGCSVSVSGAFLFLAFGGVIGIKDSSTDASSCPHIIKI